MQDFLNLRRRHHRRRWRWLVLLRLRWLWLLVTRRVTKSRLPSSPSVSKWTTRWKRAEVGSLPIRVSSEVGSLPIRVSCVVVALRVNLFKRVELCCAGVSRNRLSVVLRRQRRDRYRSNLGNGMRRLSRLGLLVKRRVAAATHMWRGAYANPSARRHTRVPPWPLRRRRQNWWWRWRRSDHVAP
ncbi:hypothetical protein Hanom_Chr00s016198g01755811 [Helianthus anomalus]